MKRLTISLAIFLLALVAGILIANQFARIPAEPGAVVTEISVANLAPIVTPVDRIPTSDPFGEIQTLLKDRKMIDLSDGGVLRRNEAVAKNGEEWMVLYRDGPKSFSIANAIASVKHLPTKSWAGDNKDSKVSIPRSGHASASIPLRSKMSSLPWSRQLISQTVISPADRKKFATVLTN